MAAADDKLPDGVTIREPLTYKNLTLLPLLTDKVPKTGDFLVLDEGMDKGLVVINEKGQGGSVNELQLENRSDKQLFLMAGEVVLGGQQDRIIGRDTIIPPKGKQDVPVFCVEHGRWSGDKRFHAGKALAHTKLRNEANYGGQGQVWQEVADKNKKRGEANETDTYRRVAEKTEKDVAAYTTYFSSALRGVAGADKVVGWAVALNGKVIAVEQFGAPALYRKMEGKLLRSYALQAADEPTDGAAKPPAAKDVVTFAAQEKEATPETAVDAPAAKARTTHLSGRGFKGSKVESTDESKQEIYKSLQVH
jgi:hypothetical protein